MTTEKASVEVHEASDEVDEHSTHSEAANQDASGEVRSDLAFPVIVEDGRQVLMPAMTTEKASVEVHEASDEVDEHSTHSEAANQDASGEVRSDFAFPAIVEDGRRLTISWNNGDDLDSVAALFAEAHGIPAEELSFIKAFLAQATTMSAGCKAETSEPNAAVEEQRHSDQKDSDLTEAKKQLEEMGFVDVLGQGSLLELITSHGGSIERVIEELIMEGQ